MKRRVLYLILFSCLWLHEVKAQDTTKPFDVSISVGYSPDYSGSSLFTFFGGFPAATTNYTQSSNPNMPIFLYNPIFHNVAPDLNLQAEYRTSSAISIGASVSYQTESVDQNFFPYGIAGSDKLTRLDISARLLYHLNKTNTRKFDHYVGLRLGASMWTDAYTPSPSFSDPQLQQTFLASASEVSPTYQFLYGFRVYIIPDWLAFNLELGLGKSPYWVAAGINFRFGKKLGFTHSRGELGR